MEKMTSIVFNCYWLIATHATDLQTLHICARSPKSHPDVRGDELVVEIVQNHRKSIRSLRLDEMSITEETLLHLSAECTHLEDLGLNVVRERLSLVSGFVWYSSLILTHSPGRVYHYWTNMSFLAASRSYLSG